MRNDLDEIKKTVEYNSVVKLTNGFIHQFLFLFLSDLQLHSSRHVSAALRLAPSGRKDI